MILLSVDGTVSVSGSRLSVCIPSSGEARHQVEPGWGGTLYANWADPPDAGGCSGRVVLEIPDRNGEYDELVLTSPRVIRVSEEGTVSLTLSEYAQVSGAFPAIGEKLGELEVRIAELEAMVGLRPQMPETGTSSPSGEKE